MSSSALRNRNYVAYLGAATISLHGVWIYRVALGWLAWQLTHSEFWVGVIAFTQFAPTFFLSPIFGVLADRFDRRISSALINTFSCANMLVLSWLAVFGNVDIYTLAAVSVVQGTLDGAYAPVRLAIVPNLVTRDQRGSAIALTSVAFNLSRFIGPAIAGLIIAIWGVGVAFFANAATYLAVVAAMAVIKLESAGRSLQPRKHPWAELIEGARYIRAHDMVRILLLLSVVRCVLARGSLEMLPAFADDIFNGGAAALSALTSAIGAGAILAGILLSRGTQWLTIGVMNTGIAVGGLFLLALGLVDDLALAIPVVAILGALLSLGGVGSQILIQLYVDDDIRGRVSSFWSAAVFGGTAFGSLIIGAVANMWGLKNAVIGAGILSIIITFAGSIRRKTRRVSACSE